MCHTHTHTHTQADLQLTQAAKSHTITTFIQCFRQLMHNNNNLCSRAVNIFCKKEISHSLGQIGDFFFSLGAKIISLVDFLGSAGQSPVGDDEVHVQ